MVRLVLLAKRPVAGRVKTRLVPPLSPEQACALYEAFLSDQVRFLRSLADRYSIEIRLAGRWSAACERRLSLAGLPRRAQGPGDLGARLLRAFEHGSRTGAEATLALAADAPTLPAALVEEAAAVLRGGAAAVVAPADDGGYVLIGMRRPLAPLFDGIPWGGPDVLRETCERAERHGVDLRMLEAWYDVDDAGGLRRLARDLAGPAAARAPATAECIAALGLTAAGGGRRLDPPR